MKNTIITIAIILLTAVTTFASNNNNTSNNNNKGTVVATTNNTVNVAISINDMNGKTVYSDNYTTNNDSNVNIKLNPTTKLAKGMYVVTVVIEGQKMTQKLVVE